MDGLYTFHRKGDEGVGGNIAASCTRLALKCFGTNCDDVEGLGRHKGASTVLQRLAFTTTYRIDHVVRLCGGRRRDGAADVTLVLNANSNILTRRCLDSPNALSFK